MNPLRPRGPRFFALLMVAAFLPGSPRSSAAEGISGAVKDKLRHATVYVENQLALSTRDWTDFTALAGGPVGHRPAFPASGSGFLISTDGYIITNAHVVDGQNLWMKVEGGRVFPVRPARPTDEAPFDPKNLGKPFTWRLVPTHYTVVVNSGEPEERVYQPKIVRVEQGADLALLKIPATERLEFLELNLEASSESGQGVLMSGFPGGILPDVAPFMNEANARALSGRFPRLSINAGMITAVREHEGHRRYQLDIRANHGNSGGPITDPEGKVIGILYAGIDGMQSIHYAIPVSEVQIVLPARLQADGAQDGEGSTWKAKQDYDDFLKSGSFFFGKRE